MATAEKILEIARSQIGARESPANSDNVKYNTAYYAVSYTHLDVYKRQVYQMSTRETF